MEVLQSKITILITLDEIFNWLEMMSLNTK